MKKILLVIFICSISISAQSFTLRNDLLDIPNPIGDNVLSASSIDFNNDGLMDIYFPLLKGKGKLLKNQGDQGFVDVLTEAGIDDQETTQFGSWGSVWGDFNNDGYLDAFFTNANNLYINNGDGTFTFANEQAEVNLLDGSFIQGMAWGDFNLDGKLDLFLGDDYGNNQLLMNVDNNKLLNFGLANGTKTLTGSYGVSCSDINGDRYPDVFIAACRINPDSSISHLLLNNGNGSFTNIGQSAGVDDSLASWSVVWLDYDNDLDMDIFETNMVIRAQTQPGYNKFYRNNGDLTFTDVALSAGVRGEEDDTKFGAASFDFNNDGWMDIYVSNTAGEDYFYINNQDGTFQNVIDQSGISDASSQIVTAADYNNDGWIDLFQVTFGEQYKLLLNNGGDNNWLKIDTRGTTSNYFGVGARIEVYTDSLSQLKEVKAGEGFISQNQNLTAHFGLGKFETVDKIIVKWPSGTDDELENVSVNQTITILEGTGIITDVKDRYELPTSFALEQNYPNPFNPSTTISFSIAEAGMYSIQVYNVLGEFVTTLANEEFTVGNYKREFNASLQSSGIYIYRLSGANVNITKKMLVIK